MELVTPTNNSEITETNQLQNNIHVPKSNSKMETFLKETITGFTVLKTKINNSELNNTSKFECIGKIQELEIQMRKLEAQNDIIFDEDYNKLLVCIKAKQNDLREKDKLISNLEDDITEFESKIRKLEREIQTLKNKVEESELELEDCETQINELNTKCKDAEKELKFKDTYSTEENLKIYSDEINDLKQSLISRENSIEEKDKIIDEYKLKLTELQGKLTARNRNFDEEIEKQNTKIENLKKETECLKSDNKRKQQEIVNMQCHIKRNDNETKDPNCNIAKLKDDFDKKCKELELANEKIFQLETEIKMKISNSANGSHENTSTEICPTKLPNWWSSHMYK